MKAISGEESQTGSKVAHLRTSPLYRHASNIARAVDAAQPLSGFDCYDVDYTQSLIDCIAVTFS